MILKTNNYVQMFVTELKEEDVTIFNTKMKYREV